VIMGEAVKIEKEQHSVTLANGDKLFYDFLIVATGARHSYFGNDSWESYAPGLQTISDALKIREKILSSFEVAERLEDQAKIAKHLNFVIIGGGPTGVEMAGAIAEIAHTTLFDNFRKIRPEKAKIYLIEALDQILPVYPKDLAERAKKELEDLGVEVITGKKVVNIDEHGVKVEDQLIESTNVIWAAGNQASSLLKTLEAPLDRQGRAVVEPDLSLPGFSNVFVIGDAACSLKEDGKPLPGIAPTAIQQGKYVGMLIKKELTKEQRPPFRYFDKGSMATIGKGKAIAVVGKFQISGFLAWLAWGFIHIIYLIGFRNRINVLIGWLATFFTGERGVRILYGTLDKDLPQKPSK
jgi:NADH dehydrogenase